MRLDDEGPAFRLDDDSARRLEARAIDFKSTHVWIDFTKGEDERRVARRVRLGLAGRPLAEVRRQAVEKASARAGRA
jgi:hypothetical protein